MEKKVNSIKFDVHVDEEKMPEKIEWTANDPSGKPTTKECKALLVGMWDGEAQESMKIDLWTKEMRVDEMNLLYYQTLHSMADTLERATGNAEAAHNIKMFANMFGENTDVVKKVDG